MKKIIIESLPEEAKNEMLTLDELEGVNGGGVIQTLIDLLQGKYTCAGCKTQGCMSAD